MYRQGLVSMVEKIHKKYGEKYCSCHSYWIEGIHLYRSLRKLSCGFSLSCEFSRGFPLICEFSRSFHDNAILLGIPGTDRLLDEVAILICHKDIVIGIAVEGVTLVFELL